MIILGYTFQKPTWTRTAALAHLKALGVPSGTFEERPHCFRYDAPVDPRKYRRRVKNLGGGITVFHGVK